MSVRPAAGAADTIKIDAKLYSLIVTEGPGVIAAIGSVLVAVPFLPGSVDSHNQQHMTPLEPNRWHCCGLDYHTIPSISCN